MIIERSKSVHDAAAVVNAIDKVCARDRGLDGRNVSKLARVSIEEWIGKAMRRAGFLVRQRHDPSNDWARETRPADAIFVIRRATGIARCGKSLRLADEKARVWVAERRYVRHRPSGEAGAQRARVRRDRQRRLVGGAREEAANATASAVDVRRAAAHKRCLVAVVI